MITFDSLLLLLLYHQSPLWLLSLEDETFKALQTKDSYHVTFCLGGDKYVNEMHSPVFYQILNT